MHTYLNVGVYIYEILTQKNQHTPKSTHKRSQHKRTHSFSYIYTINTYTHIEILLDKKNPFNIHTRTHTHHVRNIMPKHNFRNAHYILEGCVH